MPTPNPRVNVTLSPSLDNLVSRVAAGSRVSKSQVLRELLEAAEPALQQVATMMEAAAKASENLKGDLRRVIDQAHAQAQAEADAALAHLSSVSQDLVAIAEQVQSRRPARRRQAGPAPAASSGPVARSRQDPPSSNRGVKTSRKGG